MATTYESETTQLLSQLNKASDVATITTVKSKLFYLSLQHWRSVNSLEELSDEINRRFIINKSNSNEPIISDAAYQQWSATLKKGNTSESMTLARDLLTRSDQGFYQTLAEARKKAITKNQITPETVKPASPNSTIPSEDSTSVIPSGGISTTVRNSDGTFSLKTQEKPATVKNANQTTSSKKTTSSNKTQDPNYLDKRPAWIDTNTEYHRTKTADGFQVDSAYIKRYYSVIDAEVYFGNEYVEDVHNIDWTVRQNVMPLFGYNSYTYDEVARGNRIIMGEFTINFTSPNYLFSILEEANNANVTSITNMTSYTVPKLSGSNVPTIRKGTVGTKERGHHANIWPQTFDIDIIFGEKTGAGDPVHIILLGCAIQNSHMVLSASVAGSPPVVMENYSFIAQDIRTVVTGQNDNTKPNKDNNDNITSNVSDNDDKDNDTTSSSGDSDLSNLSGLKVSKENKEMAERYRKQLEEAAQKENVKKAVNTAIANAKAAQINDKADVSKKIISVISKYTGKNLSNADILRVKQVNGILLEYYENINSPSNSTGKDLSDSQTATLLARLDSNNKLSIQEQTDLAKKIKIAIAKGEWYMYSNDEEDFIAIPYDSDAGTGVALFDYDEEKISRLADGVYYQSSR